MSADNHKSTGRSPTLVWTIALGFTLIYFLFPALLYLPIILIYGNQEPPALEQRNARLRFTDPLPFRYRAPLPKASRNGSWSAWMARAENRRAVKRSREHSDPGKGKAELMAACMFHSDRAGAFAIDHTIRESSLTNCSQSSPRPLNPSSIAREWLSIRIVCNAFPLF